MTATIAAFVERIRAERRAAGRPDHIDDPAVYRILDGLLARGTTPAATEAVPSSTPSSHTTDARTGGRSG
jgi:hypothetical protein